MVASETTQNACKHNRTQANSGWEQISNTVPSVTFESSETSCLLVDEDDRNSRAPGRKDKHATTDQFGAEQLAACRVLLSCRANFTRLPM